ncbi:MAG: hypothetical protein WDO14_07015 [Bacteroidota bacterium]
MNFDLAIGVSGTELNSASQAVYSALYPGIFTGSQVVNYQGLSFNVQWDVKNAPVFDLSTQVDPSIHLNALKEKAMASNPQAIQSLDLTALAAAIPSFQVSFPLVNITLSGATSVTLPMTLTASCTVQITNNAVAFNVSQVTAPPLQDPVQNYLVQNIVLPQILKISQNLFSGITIPPLSVDGVNLSSPSVGIVNNAVIAAANLQQSGTPRHQIIHSLGPSNLFLHSSERTLYNKVWWARWHLQRRSFPIMAVAAIVGPDITGVTHLH